MKRINITPLKATIKRNYPEGSAIRDVILNEKDYLTPQEYLAKVSIWLELEGRER